MRTGEVLLGNKPFKTKKAAYKKAKVPMDPVLYQAEKWGDDEIRKRTSYLAKQGYDTAFAL